MIWGNGVLWLGGVIAVAWFAVSAVRRRRVVAPGLEAAMIFYAFGLISVTLFPMLLGSSDASWRTLAMSVNLIPFKSIREVIAIGPYQTLRQLGGNLVLLAPLGVLAPSLYSNKRTLRSLLALALSVAVTIEVLQLTELLVGVAHFRAVDIDDVILNMLGAAIGFGVWLALRALTSRCLQPTHARATLN